MENFPRISIVTPSYNQGQFLGETIQSVLDQNYPNLDYLIIDGGSSDGSVDIIRRFESSLSFWVSEMDQGQAHAINKGFDKCSGEIISWLNSDDILLPGSLHRVAEYFKKEPGLPWLVGYPMVVDDHSNVIDRRIHYVSPSFNILLFTFYTLNQESVFLRKEALGEKRLRTDLYYCFDYELWLYMAKKFGRPKVHPGFLAAYRYHSAQKTRRYEEYMLETERMKLELLPHLEMTLPEYQMKRRFWNLAFKTWVRIKKRKGEIQA
jgi:glycosyltransferase involved in cell wall biosynthesis